jgi:hypothetical protein
MNYIKSPVTLLNFACLIKSTFQWKILEDHSCGLPSLVSDYSNSFHFMKSFFTIAGMGAQEENQQNFFITSQPAFQQLELMCDNQHQHEPWGQDPSGHWRTSEETTYPWELCRAIATKLARQLQHDGIKCSPPVFALQEASLQTMRASTDLQPRRGLPSMVPEFKKVLQHPTSQKLPPYARKLSTHHGGSGASASNNSDNPDRTELKCSNRKFFLLDQWPPSEHFSVWPTVYGSWGANFSS